MWRASLRIRTVKRRKSGERRRTHSMIVHPPQAPSLIVHITTGRDLQAAAEGRLGKEGPEQLVMSDGL